MGISQKQIAEKLGVSITLVSRVLSGKAAEIGISPDTIERVVKTAGEMGYIPSAAALSLKGKATKTIGVAVYDFNDPFFGALIKQIQIQAHEHNYSLILAGFLNRKPDEQDLQSLHKHALDGLIVIGTDMEAKWLRHFLNLPVARLGHGNPSEPSVRVKVDENQTALTLLSHIVERGRKRLMYISADLPAHRIRQTAFKGAAKTCGIELLTEESSERNAFAAGLQIARQLKGEVDGLICATDQVAMGALHALHDAGVSVPDQIAVTGFDDIAAARQFIPSITTIRQPIEQIVEEAFNAVIKAEPPKETILHGKLIIRQTT
jgi:LacI family transcriptional regulator